MYTSLLSYASSFTSNPPALEKSVDNFIIILTTHEK